MPLSTAAASPLTVLNAKPYRSLNGVIQPSLQLKPPIPHCKASSPHFSCRIGLLAGKLELRACWTHRSGAFASSGYAASLTFFWSGAKLLALLQELSFAFEMVVSVLFVIPYFSAPAVFLSSNSTSSITANFSFIQSVM